MNTNTHWDKLALTYNKINWVKDTEQLEVLSSLIDPDVNKTNILDFGCGTGTVSNYLSPRCKEIVATDRSPAILEQFEPVADNILKLNIDLDNWCHLKSITKFNYFDVAIARMVFHHLQNPIKYMINIRKLIKKHGMFIIQENGISSNSFVNTWFHSMMQDKDERYYLSEESLRFNMYSAGFKAVETFRYIDRDFSIRNWLENTENNEHKINYLFNLHSNMPKEIKQVYNYREIDNDIKIDTELLFVMGFNI